ncbi:PREDICTED: histone-lysine N-methyltransferase CLF-like isoform X1 [Populus euphratica]|uniref:[histone H3]-lysine(27) N-trimethyltransferase n=1 Tax=Populus euphratica TaxID=75702 RepID=A0AAJ6X7T3_POPEU|nr:PREDICTED: histone-lysine N-methyltransferase CLF-like isoform X1 [Populus euphratica]
MASSQPSPPPSASITRSEPPKDSPMIKSNQETTLASKEVLLVIESLKKEVAADRCVYVMKRMEENRQKLVGITNHLNKLSKERKNNWISGTDNSIDLFTKRQNDALSMHGGIDSTNVDKDSHGSEEDGHASTAVLLGSSIPVKNAVRPIKLPEVNRLPPYTSWVFLDRNQRMTEDQSVVGRRRIYYDQNGGEALICSDSEEEIIDEEEGKRYFVESEDYILRMTIKEAGSSDPVVESLAHCFSRSPSEVKARFEVLKKEEKAVEDSKNKDIEAQTLNSFLVKDLEAALDSFDNLFCRRCLVFDCRLHGCSQDLIFLAEKQSPWSYPEDNITCGSHCYKLVLKSERIASGISPQHGVIEENSICQSDGARVPISLRKKSSTSSARRNMKSCQSESASSNAKNISESSDSEIGPHQDTSPTSQISPSKSMLVGKGGTCKRNSKRVAERVLSCMRKRQKKMVASDSDSVASGGLLSIDLKRRSTSHKGKEDASSSHKNAKSPTIAKSRRKELMNQGSHNLVQGEFHDGLSSEMVANPPVTSSDDTLRKEEFIDEHKCKKELSDDRSWKAIEKGLFEKGVEIFGGNSCLIARNLLNGLKTCWEVFQYMTRSENRLACEAGDAGTLGEGYSKFDFNGTMVKNEARRRSRFLRRRSKVRRLKYSWKSTAYHSFRKRITERKDQPCRQYNPCSCQTACGKQCTCLLNGTCCEKYCRCPKSCKSRFRGCHCAKSQCRSRQCPCFAADRECDPDVCRNCWISCGDGTLGIPSQRGDNYECRNMKLLLKQQQRVLLGRSDVSGWGAFLKNSVGKHEYLGEYTGELISHREADKRGKIYDRENSSFLFNLNDQFVLDAYRKGDKLKFANHSPDPNCYAKVIMVAGDHRVGIFAKERINAGEELFYDYRYEPDRAPAWARKPEASGSKKEDGSHSSGRAKKLA